MKSNTAELINLDDLTYAEGMTFKFEGKDAIRADFLKAFALDAPEQLISTETSEFSCVCPFSGLPDLGDLRVEYYPTAGRAVELKALKYYLVSFRNVGITQEEATHRIRKDLEALLQCTVRVTTIYNTRGGFDTTCTEGELD